VLFARHVVLGDEGQAEGGWLVGMQTLDVVRTAMVTHESSELLSHCAKLLTLMGNSYPSLDVRDRSRTYLHLLRSLPRSSLRVALAPPETPVELMSRTLGHAPPTEVRTRPSSFLPSALSSSSLFTAMPTVVDSLLCTPEDSKPGHSALTQLQLDLQPERRGLNYHTPQLTTNADTQAVCTSLQPSEMLAAYHTRLGLLPPPVVQVPCRLSYAASPETEACSPSSSSIFGVELTFEVEGVPPAVRDPWGEAPCGVFDDISTLHVEYLRPAADGADNSPSGSAAAELLIHACPRVPLPASFRPQVSWTDALGESWGSQLPEQHILLQDLFLPIPHHVQIDKATLFEAMWDALISADEQRTERPSAPGEIGGWHSTTVVRTPPSTWWPQMSGWLQPFLVDPEAASTPLVASPGGITACGGRHRSSDPTAPCSGDLGVTGTRVFIFLAPRHHLLLRLWAEADGGVLSHAVTDFWPVLYYVDAWLAFGEGLRCADDSEAKSLS